jgi:Fe-S-cluster-containing hydrogenase component 2
MLTRTGVPTQRQIEAVKPPPERLRKGPVAVVECFQEIPCDPCFTSCTRGAILPFADINDLPQLDYDRCNGCGTCVGFCPGLAIFIVDETYSKQEALIKIPWEFLSLPPEGSQVQGLNREGRAVARVTVKKVQRSPKKNGANILTLVVPTELAYEIRSISATPIDPDTGYHPVR